MTAQDRARQRWSTKEAQREQVKREAARSYDRHATPAATEFARADLCWHCAVNRRHRTERLCLVCASAGADPYFIPCARPGHDHVRRRTTRGQQSFTCNEPDPNQGVLL